MNIVVSCDDGCASDVRVAELCAKYHTKATFYLPVEWHNLAMAKGYEPLDYESAKKIASKFEVGAHTITHPHLTDIPINEAFYEIYVGGQMLEALFGVRVKKFAPPRGYTNIELTKFTLKHYQSQRLTKGDNLVHVHPDSGANGNVHWIDKLTTMPQNQTIELWMHSHELDRYPKLWLELEGMLSYASLPQK